MRQVPRYLIIGDGRMARHMAFYLESLGLAYQTFARKTHDFSALPELLSHTTHILILIRDDAIESFITEHLNNTTQIKVHFSGSLTTPLAYGAHPLMSFNQTLYAQETYQQMWFICEAGNKNFTEILPGFPNQHASIPVDAKALYHSLCVLSSNFTCLLWQKLATTLEDKWQIPPQAANPILQQVMQNIARDPHTALTGPLVRNDQKTIEKNLHALNDDPYQAVYQAFVSAYQQEKETK